MAGPPPPPESATDWLKQTKTVQISHQLDSMINIWQCCVNFSINKLNKHKHKPHVTRDRWKDLNLLSKCQLPSLYGLGAKVCWRYFHKGSISYLNNQWINDKGVCRQPWLCQKQHFWGQHFIMITLYVRYFCYITIIKWSQNCFTTIIECIFGDV